MGALTSMGDASRPCSSYKCLFLAFDLKSIFLMAFYKKKSNTASLYTFNTEVFQIEWLTYFYVSEWKQHMDQYLKK